MEDFSGTESDKNDSPDSPSTKDNTAIHVFQKEDESDVTDSPQAVSEPLHLSQNESENDLIDFFDDEKTSSFHLHQKEENQEDSSLYKIKNISLFDDAYLSALYLSMTDNTFIKKNQSVSLAKNEIGQVDQLMEECSNREHDATLHKSEDDESDREDISAEDYCSPGIKLDPASLEKAKAERRARFNNFIKESYNTKPNKYTMGGNTASKAPTQDTETVQYKINPNNADEIENETNQNIADEIAVGCEEDNFVLSDAENGHDTDQDSFDPSLNERASAETVKRRNRNRRKQPKNKRKEQRNPDQNTFIVLQRTPREPEQVNASPVKDLHFCKSVQEIILKAKSEILNINKASLNTIAQVSNNLVKKGDEMLTIGDEELAYLNYLKYVQMCIQADECGVSMDTSQAKYCMEKAEILTKSLKSRYAALEHLPTDERVSMDYAQNKYSFPPPLLSLNIPKPDHDYIPYSNPMLARNVATPYGMHPPMCNPVMMQENVPQKTGNFNQGKMYPMNGNMMQGNGPQRIGNLMPGHMNGYGCNMMQGNVPQQTGNFIQGNMMQGNVPQQTGNFIQGNMMQRNVPQQTGNFIQGNMMHWNVHQMHGNIRPGMQYNHYGPGFYPLNGVPGMQYPLFGAPVYQNLSPPVFKSQNLQELKQETDKTATQRAEATMQKAEAAQRAKAITQKAEATTQKAKATAQKAEATTQKAAATTQKAEATTQKAEVTAQKTEVTAQKAEATTQKAEATTQKAEATTQKTETPTQKAKTAHTSKVNPQQTTPEVPSSQEAANSLPEEPRQNLKASEYLRRNGLISWRSKNVSEQGMTGTELHGNTRDVNSAAGVEGNLWVSTTGGDLLQGAVIGGANHIDKIYVARIHYEGSILPGKLIPQYKTCFVSLEKKQIKSKIYEVLCDANTGWLKMNKTNYIPHNAILGGMDMKNNDTLYIGRVKHGSSVTCGKVQGSDRKCYILYGDMEHEYDDYELLVQTKPSTVSSNDRPTQMRFRRDRSTQRVRRDPETSRKFVRAETYLHPKANDVKKIEEKFKLIPLDTKDKDYSYVSTKMQKSIMSHVTMQFTKYNIVSIEKVWNTKIYARYMQHVLRLKEENNDDANEKKLFHGSPVCNDIVKNGFDERHASVSGMFGAGVYFAEHSSKSNQYAFGLNKGCPSHNSPSCKQCNRVMMLCRVALGKAYECNAAKNFAHAPPGHHSVFGTTALLALRYPEYIIYRGEQAFPLYLITYKIE